MSATGFVSPYEMTLIDFKHDRYLGTNTPKNFSSLVRVVDPERNVDHDTSTVGLEVIIFVEDSIHFISSELPILYDILMNDGGDTSTFADGAEIVFDTTGYTANLGEWISVGNFRVDFSFLVDRLTIIMMLVITGVGTLIHIYSTGYMAAEAPGTFGRFFTSMS